MICFRVEFADYPRQPNEDTRGIFEYTNAEWLDRLQLVEHFFYENSRGALTMEFAVFPGAAQLGSLDDFTDSNGILDLPALAQAVEAEAQPGILADYDYWMLAVPEFSSNNLGLKDNGCVVMERALSADAIIAMHEMGHVIGLGHAARYGAVDGNPLRCEMYLEYGDFRNVMGIVSDSGLGENTFDDRPAPHFSAAQKRHLGWLQEDEVTVVETSGVYPLNRHDRLEAAGPQLIELTGKSGRAYYLDLEAIPQLRADLLQTVFPQASVSRPKTGARALTDNDSPRNGFLDYNGTVLIDLDPHPLPDPPDASVYSEWASDDTALAAGEVYHNLDGIRIEVLSMETDSATGLPESCQIRIDFNDSPPPTETLLGATGFNGLRFTALRGYYYRVERSADLREWIMDQPRVFGDLVEREFPLAWPDGGAAFLRCEIEEAPAEPPTARAAQARRPAKTIP